MSEGINFPQYRKQANERNYYEIRSDSQMSEIQIVGTKYLLFEITATIMPERWMIKDVLEGAVVIEKAEYDAVKAAYASAQSH